MPRAARCTRRAAPDSARSLPPSHSTNSGGWPVGVVTDALSCRDGETPAESQRPSNVRPLPLAPTRSVGAGRGCTFGREPGNSSSSADQTSSIGSESQCPAVSRLACPVSGQPEWPRAGAMTLAAPPELVARPPVESFRDRACQNGASERAARPTRPGACFETKLGEPACSGSAERLSLKSMQKSR